MGLSALPIVLIFLLVFLTWQTIYSANRDLVRAKAWEDLARRAMPFGALALMALSLFLVQQYRQGWVMITWMAVSGVLIVIASLFSVPALERRASRAFRQRDYQKAAELYGELAEERPLARNHAFLGAALGALLILAVLTFFIGRQNRDLLRVRAYRDFFLRLIPPLSTGVFVAGLPFVMDQATVYNYGIVLFVYLGGAAILTAIMARAVIPEERRAGTAFRKGEYEKAAGLYEELVARRQLPRYYSALGASLDASGNPRAALEATDRAIKLDPRLGIAYYNRASALAALGERARARGDLHTVFQVDSGRNLRRAAAEALEILEKG